MAYSVLNQTYKVYLQDELNPGSDQTTRVRHPTEETTTLSLRSKGNFLVLNKKINNSGVRKLRFV